MPRSTNADTGPRRQALATLYRSPLADFTAVRKRLAGELRTQKDPDGAKDIAARRRPTAAAWAVNQLYWRSPDTLDAMTAAAARVKSGDLDATAAYRRAVASARVAAERILTGAGRARSEDVLRRVGATLAAIAVNGFGPDAPGMLVDDRPAPGFEAAGVSAAAAPSRREAPASRETPDRNAESVPKRDARAAAAAERQRRAAEREAARRRRAEEKTRAAERRRREGRVRAATDAVARAERTVERLRAKLSAADVDLDTARAELADATRRLEETS